MRDRRWVPHVRLVCEQNAPGTVVLNAVAVELGVLGAREYRPGADGCRPSKPIGGIAGDVGVVVVVDVVVVPDVADAIAERPRCAARALAVLRRGRIVVVLGILGRARLVVVELGVLDGQVPARIGA